jgi:uncharacterized membrane protein
MSNLSREFSFAGVSAGHDQSAVPTATVPAAEGSGAQVLRRAPYVMVALALLGMAVAFYDSYAIYNGQPLWCPPPINGCNEVAASPYARIFDLPVGYYGVVYYLYMFGLAVLLVYDPSARGLRVGAVLYAALGVSLSLYFMVLQLGLIRAFCIYCLVSAMTTLLLAVAAVALEGSAHACGRYMTASANAATTRCNFFRAFNVQIYRSNAGSGRLPNSRHAIGPASNGVEHEML